MLRPHPELERGQRKRVQAKLCRNRSESFRKCQSDIFGAGLFTCEVVDARVQMHACQWVCAVSKGAVQGKGTACVVRDLIHL